MTDNAIEWLTAQVRQAMEGVEPGHDFAHIQRVVNNACLLQQTEGGDPLVVALAALCHEMADTKFFDPKASMAQMAQWFEAAGIDEDTTLKVTEIVNALGFSKSINSKAQPATIAFAIVQDADLLEAVGSIGIARTFSYGASKGRQFFDEYQFPTNHADAKSYRSTQSPTINHFFEKLFLLKDKMRTTTAKQLAAERHKTMWLFVYQFFIEHPFIDGDNKTRWLQHLNHFK